MSILIDADVEKLIQVEVCCAFEQLASDIMEGDEPNADDSYEPVLWHMQAEFNGVRGSKNRSAKLSNSHAILSDILSETHSHPDYGRFREIVLKELRKYF